MSYKLLDCRNNEMVMKTKIGNDIVNALPLRVISNGNTIGFYCCEHEF